MYLAKFRTDSFWVTKASVIPIWAQLNYNIDVVCEYSVTEIPIPTTDFTSAPNMIVIAKQVSEADEVKGGVAGGIILGVSFKHRQGVSLSPLYVC